MLSNIQKLFQDSSSRSIKLTNGSKAIKQKLQSDPNAKILVTSFVRTVPKVLANLSARLSGELARDRVDFKTVHALAMETTRIPFEKIIKPDPAIFRLAAA